MKRALTGLAIGLVVAFWVGLGIFAISNAKTSEKAPETAKIKVEPPTRAQLLKLVNEERAKYGVAPLKENAKLNKSAQWKADDMERYDYFGHVKPGTTGNNGLDYLHTLHVECVYVSENLHWAGDYPLTAAQTMRGWINSKPHHRAMIDPKYTLTGFGIVHDAVVEHFCQQ